MDYRNELREENEAVKERFLLSMERISAMDGEEIREPYGAYFKRVAAFIGQIGQLVARRQERSEQEMSLEELQLENQALYQDILPENYKTSYGNPDFAVKELGDGLGQLLSFLYTEIRAGIVYAFEMRLCGLTVLNELFLEV